MPFYELIYETGAVSVANYADDAECLRAVSAHHDRAKTGVPALTTPDNEPNRPSERIARVLKYDVHPVEYGTGQEIAVDEVKSKLNEALTNLEHDGTVRVPDLAAAVRDMSSPLVSLKDRKSMHDSNYKMQEAEELSSDRWDNNAA